MNAARRIALGNSSSRTNTNYTNTSDKKGERFKTANSFLNKMSYTSGKGKKGNWKNRPKQTRNREGRSLFASTKKERRRNGNGPQGPPTNN